MTHCKFLCLLLLLTLSLPVWSEEGFADLPLSPDSIVIASAINSDTEIMPDIDQPVSINQRQNIETARIISMKEDETLDPSDIYVLLVPQGEINSSFKSAVDASFIYQLRNAINRTQLNHRGEDDFVPISTAQTVDLVQNYLALSVQRALSECNVQTHVLEDTTQSESANRIQPESYIYRVDLGVNRLTVVKSLLSSKLYGEASANVFEKNQHAKNLSVSSYSFSDNDLSLSHYGEESLQRDAELKTISSKIVDRLGERLGRKMCQYFK